MEKTTKNKIQYLRTLQADYHNGNGWEDIDFYPMTSTGYCPLFRQARETLKAYQTEYPQASYRLVDKRYPA